MATALKALKPTKPGSTTFKHWKDLIFLVKEPNRKGIPVWWVRVVVGDLDPFRAGPYSSEKEARKKFATIVDDFEDGIRHCTPVDGNYEV